MDTSHALYDIIYKFDTDDKTDKSRVLVWKHVLTIDQKDYLERIMFLLINMNQVNMTSRDHIILDRIKRVCDDSHYSDGDRFWMNELKNTYPIKEK